MPSRERVIIRWRHGYPEPSGRWCYAADAVHADGSPGWGAVVDQPGRAKVFANVFRAARWWLKRHAWPRDVLADIREARVQFIPRGGELPLFDHEEVVA